MRPRHLEGCRSLSQPLGNWVKALAKCARHVATTCMHVSWNQLLLFRGYSKKA